MIKFINYKDDLSIYDECFDLIKNAFPKEEIPPMKMLFNRAKYKRNANLFGVFDENTFIGIIYLINKENFDYLFLLAVKEEYRNKGYGSKVLTKLKEEHSDKPIILSYEEVNEKYANYEQRVKRQKFYEDNGFIDTKLKVKEANVIYSVASTLSFIPSKKEYQSIYSDFAPKSLLKLMIRFI